jgi:4-hydroxy-4-methyl-2-oxoglutarate aldolase
MTTEPTTVTTDDPPADDLIARLSPLDVCCVSDALDALGIEGVVDGLTPVWEGAKVVGRAVTTKLAPGPAPAGTPPVHLGARAIERSRPGEVIVVDNGGRDTMGSWGGLLALAASLRGVAGVVLDGACRDVDEAREMSFPAFARRGAVRTARGRVHEESCGEPVSLAGIAVNPGDIVMADGSGVVVLPAADAPRVVERAEQIARRERAMQTRLQAGDSVSEVLGASYEDMLK